MTRFSLPFLLAGVATLVFSSGCTTMSVTPLRQQPLPQVKAWETVVVYADSGEIDGPYEEVAVLNVPSAPTKEKLLHDCQCRAAALGADGILIEEIAKHKGSAWGEIGGVPVMLAHDAWHGRVLAVLVTPQ